MFGMWSCGGVAGGWTLETLFHNVGHEQCTKHDANAMYAILVSLDRNIPRVRHCLADKEACSFHWMDDHCTFGPIVVRGVLPASTQVRFF